MIDKTVVGELDIDRYVGTWYEIARYDNRFEKGLVGVTANYSILENGKIQVLNSGFEGNLKGKRSIAKGKAKIPNLNEPAKLKVSFFWFFYSDYLVLELDPDYQYAVIGSNSDKYLWILSKKPSMEEELYQDLLQKIHIRGYDISKLITVEQ